MTQKRYTEIPKRQKCVNKEEPYIGGAEDIVDDALGKPQSEVNQDRIEDIASEVQRAQGAESTLEGKIATEKQRAEGVESGLNNRLGTVEQLAEISIGGGDAQIATGADFTNPDATKRAKVPTVGAIVDGLNDGIYDVSKRNPTGGPNSDGKFTLEYILSNADTLIPTSWRHGGMTISFVDSSDNMYVQYRLMSNTWSIDTVDWALCSEDVLIDNPEWMRVVTDSEYKILYGVKTDGKFYFGDGCPPQVVDYVGEKLGSLIDGDTLTTLLNAKVDKVIGKSLIDSNVALNIIYDTTNEVIQTLKPVEVNGGAVVSNIQNPEFIDVKTDAEYKIFEANMPDGTKYLPAGAKILGKFEIEGAEYTSIQNQEWLSVLVDAQERIIAGVRLDGSVFINNIEGFTERVQEVVNALFINKTTLDKFSENNGTLLWNDSPIEGGTISTLVVDLPVSDGTDIESGYAYIDSTDRTIKVKA